MNWSGILLSAAASVAAWVNAAEIGDVIFREDFSRSEQWSPSGAANFANDKLIVTVGGQAEQTEVGRDVFGNAIKSEKRAYVTTRGIAEALKPYIGYQVEVAADIRAEGVPREKAPWESVRFALNFATTTGAYTYSRNGLFGTFDSRRISFLARIPHNLTDASVTLGVISDAGRAEFANLEIRLAAPPRSAEFGKRTGPMYKGHELERLRGFNSCDNMLRDGHVARFADTWNANVLKSSIYLPDPELPEPEMMAAFDKELAHWDEWIRQIRRTGAYVVFQLFPTSKWRDAEQGGTGLYYLKPGYAEKFVKLWETAARRFRGEKRIWGFELLNETQLRVPPAEGCPDYEGLMGMAARAINAIDPERTVIIQPEEWFGMRAFDLLRPIDAENVVYAVHFYAPFAVTHQNLRSAETAPVAYPGVAGGHDWNKARLLEELQPAIDFQKAYNVHMFVSEFSCIRWAPGAEQWLDDSIALFEELGWDWLYHAVLEWPGWSPELGADRDNPRTVPGNPRETVLRNYMKANRKLSPEAVAPLPTPEISRNGCHAAAVLITGADNQLLTPGASCSRLPWAKDRKNSVWAGTPLLPNDGWFPFEFTFTPAQDGTVTLTLIASPCRDKSSNRENECMVAWDDLKLDGAKLVNGNFELRDAQGKFVTWPWSFNGQKLPENTPPPKEGSHMMPVIGNRQAAQTGIAVTAGRPVTFSGFVRVIRCVPKQ